MEGSGRLRKLPTKTYFENGANKSDGAGDDTADEWKSGKSNVDSGSDETSVGQPTTDEETQPKSKRRKENVKGKAAIRSSTARPAVSRHFT